MNNTKLFILRLKSLKIFLNYINIKTRIVEGKFEKENSEIFSKRVKAGKRTYFFDVKETRSEDYYLTITESKRKPKGDGFTYEKHKIFLYKEDFGKFVKALNESVDHIKDELLPEVDFAEFDKEKDSKAPTDWE